MNGTTCKGRTKAGEPCRSTFVGADGRCPAHGANGAQEMRKRGLKGGVATARIRKVRATVSPDDAPPAPKTLEDAEQVASWITYAVLTGEIDVRVAEAATKAVRQFQLSAEKRVLQDRVRELERALREASR